MRIRYEQLANKLKQILATVYCIHGEEPLLIEEALLAIRHSAEERGFQEREIATPENNSQWQHLEASYYEQSLFATNTLLECRVGNGKIGKEGARVIRNWLTKINQNKCLVFLCGKLDTAIQQSAWFKTLEKIATMVTITKLQSNQYASWMKQRIHQKGKQIEDSALTYLVDALEGNLLAAHQEIEKLCTLSSESIITMDAVIESVTTHRQFNLYELADTTLSGDRQRTLTCFQQLKDEQTEPALLLWVLTKQCRELLQMTMLVKLGHSIANVLATSRIWTARKPLIQKSLLNSSVADWTHCLELAFTADKVNKGIERGDIWQTLLILADSMSRVCSRPYE